MMTKHKRFLVYMKYEGHCAYCGCNIEKSFTVDHIKAQAKGGTDDMSNLFPACRVCNLAKGKLSVSEFRQRLLKGNGIKYTPFMWIQQRYRKNTWDGHFYFEKHILAKGGNKCS